ncbi:hypothetical protein NGM37_07405, partial [Streptomyces sp. TRM76130]|nr:hypothetical protein [Streptomyces sp. TRM76130]
VPLDDGQRRVIAAQLTAADVPEGLPGPAPDAPVTVQDLDRAGVPLTSEQRVQSVLSGGPLSLAFGDLPVVDQVKVLMTRPGPWPASLDAVAAGATRRL